MNQIILGKSNSWSIFNIILIKIPSFFLIKIIFSFLRYIKVHEMIIINKFLTKRKNRKLVRSTKFDLFDDF